MASSLFETVQQFFQEDNWTVYPLEGRSVLQMIYQGQNGQFNGFAQVIEEYHQFIFYAVSAFNIAEELRPAMAEFLTRANYGLRLGNFEMDYEDGQVRFKCSLDMENEPLTTTLVRPIVYTAVLLMDRYLPGIMAVAFGGKTPLEAINQVEAE